jgi:hypothetical protein
MRIHRLVPLAATLCALAVPGRPVDRTAPRLSRVRLSRTRLHAGRRAVLRLRLSEPARLTVSVNRVRRRRRGTLHRTLGAGTAKIPFSVRRLAVGRHRLTLVARDAAGNASRPVTVRFTIVR